MNPADFMVDMKKESSREKERKEEEKKLEGNHYLNDYSRLLYYGNQKLC